MGLEFINGQLVDGVEKARAKEAIRQRDIREAEEDRIRLTPKFWKENASPARSAACPSCGHRHKGATSQSEELRKLWCHAS